MKHDKELNVQSRVGALESVVDRPVARPPLAKLATAVLRRIVTVASLGTVRSGPGEVDFGGARLRPKMSAYRASLLLLVVVPSVVAWVYLAFLASDQYLAETRFAVRAAQLDLGEADKIKSALGSLGSGSAVSLAGQDGYVITTYIGSRAILDDLSKIIDVKAIFTRPEGDFWARLKRDATAEDLLRYWQRMVSAHVDGPSGIVTVSVRAFRPGDALDLAGAITKVSETLINSVSARARADAMRRAGEEVKESEGHVQAALADMRAFRDKAGYLDPTSAATATSQLLAQVMTQKIQLESDLFVATRATSADAPQLKSLQTRLVGLDQQIDQLKAQMTGKSSDRQTLSASLATFEELELHRIFAEKLYTMAQDGLERARKKAEAQNIYISVFVPPSLPEEARYPERISMSLIIPIALLIIWGILALMAASIEDHRF